MFLAPYLLFEGYTCMNYNKRVHILIYVCAQAPVMDGPVQLTPPPYGLSALEPHMSRDTMDHHW